MTNYDIIASHFCHTRKYVWDDMRQLLDQIPAGAKILDLGCGNGRVLSLWQTKKINYLGIDQSNLLLYKAKQAYPQYKFIRADITKNKTFNNLSNYDFVLLFAVLHHILKPWQQIKLFKNIDKVLNKRGKLLATVWNTQQKDFQHLEHQGNIVIKPYKLSDGKSVTKTVNRKICMIKPKDIQTLADKANLNLIKYYFAKRGQKTTEKEGYNLCFEMEKKV